MARSWAWADIMLYLWEENNGASKTDIKKHLRKDSESAIVTNIMKLEAFGYINILRCAFDDQRKVGVFVTEQGKKLCKALAKLKKALGKNWKKL